MSFIKMQIIRATKTVEQAGVGRIVVLPEYRHQGLGTLVVQEAEKWAKEQGFTTTVLESRDKGGTTRLSSVSRRVPDSFL